MHAQPNRASTGVAGLDDILRGGLTPHRLYLVEGTPGSGKTTLGFQFLLAGAAAGESVLYLTLSETDDEIRAVARSHGWSLDQIVIQELASSEDALNPHEQYTVFHPAEVELSETTKKILAVVERLKPSRVVFDSLSELRLLAGNPLRYRRQMLAMKQYFAGRQCTVLMLDDLTATDRDLQVMSIAHGAILLEHSTPSFGGIRRRLTVHKFRGSGFRTGYHDYTIEQGGLRAYPRLVAAEHRTRSSRERIPSDLDGLDSLLGGGIERGTSTIIQGAAGSGKSTIASLFAVSAARRGQHAAMFIFDESVNTLLSRTDGMGIPLRAQAESGHATIQQIDPAELSPGQFVDTIRHAVEQRGATVVVIDSLNGYLQSMPDEKFLVVQLHELLTYLGQMGVATILIAAQQGMLGPMPAAIDVSYLADSVLLVRYFEDAGDVRQALSVVKMRGGRHERTIRALSMSDRGITIGEPLREYRGVLTGVPVKKEA